MNNVHIDVDNLWVYEQEYGINFRKSPEYIYKQSLPLFLKLLKQHGTHATFMIIGKDLILPACRAFCRSAISQGHEIGNHTWSHPTRFGSFSPEQKRIEILKAHQAITKVCKKPPVGFRGPGYFIDTDIVKILALLRYEYDSSVLPGFTGVGMSFYARWRGGSNKQKSFGRLRDVFSQTAPYVLAQKAKQKAVVEYPITVMPWTRLPIHSTFVYLFGSVYQTMVSRYLRHAPKHLVYVFHAIDLVKLSRQSEYNAVITLSKPFSMRRDFVDDALRSIASRH